MSMKKQRPESVMQQETEEVEVEEEDSEEEVEVEDIEDEEGGFGTQDGMANMMAKILQQQVEGGRGPVLAKRKTTIMKQLEQEKASKDRLRLARKQKKEDKSKFLIVPDHSTIDYERQLRKVATRGVVALFNAITKAKREEQENSRGDVKTDRSSKAAEVGALSRVNFVSLLQKETQRKKQESVSKNTGGTSQSDASLFAKDADNDREYSDINKSKSDIGNASAVGRSMNSESKGWRALNDTFLIDKKLALKDWDKDDADNDEDSETSDEDASGKRPNPNSKIEDPFRELSEEISRADDEKKAKGKKRSMNVTGDDDDTHHRRRRKRSLNR